MRRSLLDQPSACCGFDRSRGDLGAARGVPSRNCSRGAWLWLPLSLELIGGPAACLLDAPARTFRGCCQGLASSVGRDLCLAVRARMARN